MLEDELLKRKLRRGSREALARVYEKYVDAMLTLAVGLLNNRAVAEDVVQDVFVSFAQGAESFTLTGNLRAYLARSVVNRVRDRRRRQRSQQRRVDVLATTAGGSTVIDRTLVYNERCERLSAALEQLPYEQREVVVLKVKHDMTLREIARIQGVSISTVHGRYRYGLDKLRALLNGDMDHE